MERLAEKRRRMARILRYLQRRPDISFPEASQAARIVFHPDGRHFFNALFKAIDEAEKLICLEYYRISADNTGKKLADLLMKATRRGVPVFLIFDAIGCHKTPGSYFEELSQNGVTCLAFNPVSFRRLAWFDRRDHRKIAIIDGKTAFLGGLNIADEYAGVCEVSNSYHDVGFHLYGQAAAALLTHFSEIWRLEQGSMPALPALSPVPAKAKGNAGIIFVTGGPHHRRSDIRAAFRFAMASANDELLIANPYFIPGPLIMRSLLRAAKRGVRIRLLLPSRSDVPVVKILSRSSYGPLLEAGIEIYELERELLHAKIMFIDGKRTVIGSANLDQRSFHRNFEINAIISSRDFAAQIKDLFKNDFLHSTRITSDSHERRGVMAIILEKLLRPFCWFL